MNTRNDREASKRCYWKKVEEHRCVVCGFDLPIGYLRRRCRTCSLLETERRTGRDMALPVIAKEEEPRVDLTGRCPKCHLVLPHDGCLPTIYAYASNRRAVD